MDTNTQTTEDKPNLGHPRKPQIKKTRSDCKIDVKKAIKQRLDKGMSLQEIADNQGVSKQAVSTLLQRVRNEDVIRAYTNKRPEIYSLLESDILSTIDNETIKDSSLLQRVTAAGILKTHYNLETGRASVITGYDPKVIIQGIAELRGMVKVEPECITINESDTDSLHNMAENITPPPK